VAAWTLASLVTSPDLPLTIGIEELNFAEQAKAINIKAVWFLDATRSHIRKCVQEHGTGRAQDMPRKVAQQLRSMADQVEAIPVPETLEFHDFPSVK
jgi:DNA topoisomerase IA